MRKIGLLLVLLMGLTIPVKADPPLFEYQGINIHWPLKSVNAVYLYDFVGNKDVVGGETAVISYGAFEGVIGAIGDLENSEVVKGTPFFGVHLKAPETWMGPRINVGLYAGRNFRDGSNTAGIKSSIPLW